MMATMTKILISAMAMGMIALGVNGMPAGNNQGNPDNGPSGAARQCICTIKGDPHIKVNQGRPYLLRLPCAHKIAKLVTPPKDGSCDLRINGRAEFTNANDLSGPCYETLIHIRLEFEGKVFTLILSKNNSPAYNITGAADIDAAGVDIQFVPGLDGFYRVRIKACEMIFTYKPSKSSFMMSVPIGIADNEGICGTCDGKLGGSSNPSEELLLANTLESLDPFSPINNADINTYQVCTSLTFGFGICQDKDFAATMCAPLLVDTAVRNCVSSRLDQGESVLSNYNDCINGACSTSSSCDLSTYNDFFHSCADGHINSVCI